MIKKDYYTFDEYLKLEETAKNKSEYDQGKIYFVPTITTNQRQIIQNLTAVISERSCQIFTTNTKLQTQEKFIYPDMMVVCGDVNYYKEHTNIITNPTIIIEIVSDYKKADECAVKFESYWQLGSLQEGVVIDSRRYYAECWRRDGSRWRFDPAYFSNQALKLQSLEIEINLKQIYSDVNFL